MQALTGRLSKRFIGTMTNGNCESSEVRVVTVIGFTCRLVREHRSDEKTGLYSKSQRLTLSATTEKGSVAVRVSQTRAAIQVESSMGELLESENLPIDTYIHLTTDEYLARGK